MFGRKSKEDLLIDNVKLTVQNESLIKQLETMTKMVDTLQSALVAKESPKAYEDHMIDRASSKTFKASNDKVSEQQRIINDYLNAMENGRLNDSSDLEDLLKCYTTPLTGNPVSDNSES